MILLGKMFWHFLFEYAQNQKKEILDSIKNLKDEVDMKQTFI